MAIPSPERLRELATLVALSVAADAGRAYVEVIDRNAALIRLNNLRRMGDPRLFGFWRLEMHEQHDIAQAVADLARTAVITVTIPEA